MTIDQNTGLPQLPEGYFWRVDHPNSYGDWSPFQLEDKTTLQVRLMMELPDKAQEDGRHWLIKRIFPLDNTATPQDPLSLYKRKCKGMSNQAIVNAAYQILKQQSHDKRVASKLGDYPPKKLES